MGSGFRWGGGYVGSGGGVVQAGGVQVGGGVVCSGGGWVKCEGDGSGGGVGGMCVQVGEVVCGIRWGGGFQLGGGEERGKRGWGWGESSTELFLQFEVLKRNRPGRTLALQSFRITFGKC